MESISSTLDLGVVEGDMPRIAAVQEKGCIPISDAFWKVETKLNKTISAPTGMRVPGMIRLFCSILPMQ